MKVRKEGNVLREREKKGGRCLSLKYPLIEQHTELKRAFKCTNRKFQKTEDRRSYQKLPGRQNKLVQWLSNEDGLRFLWNIR